MAVLAFDWPASYPGAWPSRRRAARRGSRKLPIPPACRHRRARASRPRTSACRPRSPRRPVAPASRPMVSSVLCRCVASPPPDPAASASSSASSPASVDPCGGAVCGGPDHRLRLWSLFQTLDVNRDGGLCVNDLAVGLRRLGLHRTEGELRVGNADRSARAGKGPPFAPQHLREVQVTGLVCATGFSGSPLELGRLGGGLSGWLRPLDDRLGHPH